MNINHVSIRHLLSEQLHEVCSSIDSIDTFSTKQIGEAADTINELTLNNGIVYFTGVGKNGHVASMAASTFASLGIRCIFLNPVDAVHGDMGVISPNDLVFAISKSGKTSELLNFLECLKKSKPDTQVIFLSAEKELKISNTNTKYIYCPCSYEMLFDIVPTTSLLNFLLVLQTIALLISCKRKLELKDFKTNHPGGEIGQKLKSI
jgi:arabinose-5-phosphate isomerase